MVEAIRATPQAAFVPADGVAVDEEDSPTIRAGAPLRGWSVTRSSRGQFLRLYGRYGYPSEC